MRAAKKSGYYIMLNKIFIHDYFVLENVKEKIQFTQTQIATSCSANLKQYDETNDDHIEITSCRQSTSRVQHKKACHCLPNTVSKSQIL